MKTPNTSDGEIQNQDCGTLYVVSTPIGNLEDITLRALRILKTVHIIAAENVAHTRGLCRNYGIKTLVIGYHQHNEKVKGPELIKRLKSGLDIALVTDAGTPGISDPGAYLVSMAANDGIKATPVPGPSAPIAALSVSGFPTDKFVFMGFLSNRPGKRKNELSKLVSEPRTMIFFESPHRVRAMLIDLREILGDRQIVMQREMTKVFEEAKRGSVSVVLEHLKRSRIRGEFTLVVPGTQETTAHGLTEDL
ncbi:MAG: 16S rRNA (cytidine(1402)-2'-O)-methyltransferase, partial [Thermodesulfobacteriota bacterium]|nr:16S rRNA (cytidine(1402)-2'-O)-methyltransferase [Thermodesulfobacteriota bacterium]